MAHKKKSSHFECLMLVSFVMTWSACAKPTDQKKDHGLTAVRHMRTKFQNEQLNHICNKILAINDTEPLISRSEIPDRFLRTHNEIRALYKLSPLVWDHKLADYAQRWADYLKSNYKCVMEHRSDVGILEGENYGENLAWNWTSAKVPANVFKKSPEFANLGWSQECIDYDFGDGSCTPGKKCGHFTQVVWKEAKKVGCGVAICDDDENSEGEGRAEVWVCNYNPPGNVRITNYRGKITKLKPF